MDLVKYEEGIEEISNYFSQPASHFSLLVNCDNYDDVNNIIRKYRADSSVKILYLSDYVEGDVLPKLIEILVDLEQQQDNILFVGLSQFLHFSDNDKAIKFLSQAYQLSIHGKIVFLLEHYQQLLQELVSADIRKKRQTILLEGDYQELPQIIALPNKDYCKKLPDFTALLKYLEQSFSTSGDSKIKASFLVHKNYFIRSSYQMTFIESNYDMIKTFYPNEIDKLKQTDGNEDQWGQLLSDLEKYTTISKVFQSYPKKISLYENIAETIKKKGSLQSWYFWLEMKYFTPVVDNEYFTYCLSKTNSYDELEHAIYFTILDYNYNDSLFEQFYKERKNILNNCTINTQLLEEYLDSIHKFQKNCLYYLTDKTDKEQQEIMRSLFYYSYEKKEIMQIAKLISRDLLYYLEHFEFKPSNLKLPESDTALYNQFNEYFDAYKLNKVINKVPDDFIELVNQNASLRPYNKLQTRISIIKKLQHNNMKIFFIDALGVEYLAYIQKKCDQYNLIADIQIGKSELPSITEINKDFYDIFTNKVNIIENKALDKIKHEDQLVDYEKCKEPIHLFDELHIINETLERIQTELYDKQYEKALIVSDHGASRLAVLYGQDSASPIEIAEKKGKYSGRCCQIEKDLQLPNSTYENGYVILANYDRFKGSRRANVEVHGGASLEEVLVPIISLSLKQENKLHFESSVVLIKPKEIPEIILISSKSLVNPILEVNNIKYVGEHCHRNHYKFKMPDMKRTKDYQAIVFDGDCEIGKLEFSTQSSLVKNNDDMLL